MRESRLSGSVEGVMSNHDPYSDSPSLLVGFGTTKVYSGMGADIVMESIAVIDRGFERYVLFSAVASGVPVTHE